MVKLGATPKRKQEEPNMSMAPPTPTPTVKPTQPSIPSASSAPNMSKDAQAPPSANFKSSVNFLPEGRVAYSVGGKNYNLSRQEYQGVLALKGSKTGGTASPQVKDILSQENVARAAATKQFESQQVEGAAKSLGIQPFGEADVPSVGELGRGEQVPSNMLSEGLGNIAESVTAPRPIKSTLSTVAELLFTGLDIIPFVESPRANPKIQNTKSTLTNINSLISTDIGLVSQGLKDPNEVTSSLQEAAFALNRVERTTKGLGKASPRYWLDQGKEIETFLVVERGNLDSLRTQLIVAAEEGRLSRAQAFLGQ